MWPVVPFIESDCRILWSSISLERIKRSYFFFQWKVAPETTNFWLIVTCCVSHPVRLGDSLISNKTGRTNSSLISYMEIIVKGRLPLLVGCGQVCLGANQIPGSFDHQDLWKEITDTSDYCPSFLLIYFYAFFIKYRRVPFSYDSLFPYIFYPYFLFYNIHMELNIIQNFLMYSFMNPF